MQLRQLLRLPYWPVHLQVYILLPFNLWNPMALMSEAETHNTIDMREGTVI